MDSATDKASMQEKRTAMTSMLERSTKRGRESSKISSSTGSGKTHNSLFLHVFAWILLSFRSRSGSFRAMLSKEAAKFELARRSSTASRLPRQRASDIPR